MCNDKKDSRCLGEILRTILILQQNAICTETGLELCDRGSLNCSAVLGCNTRPVILYPCCGNPGVPLSMPINRTVNGETSPVFRIEKIDENCATFRVLAENNDDEPEPFVATNSFFTVDLSKLLSIRCLPDTFIEGI